MKTKILFVCFVILLLVVYPAHATLPLILACILWPIHLIILWDEDGFAAAEREFRLVFDIATWIISMFIKIVQTILALIGCTIESIPVIE